MSVSLPLSKKEEQINLIVEI